MLVLVKLDTRFFIAIIHQIQIAFAAGYHTGWVADSAR